MSKKWFGPDFGGTYWLDSAKYEDIGAAVCQDPSGDTSRYLWAIQIDEYANNVAEGEADTLELALAGAKASLKAYEKHLDKYNKVCFNCGKARN